MGKGFPFRSKQHQRDLPRTQSGGHWGLGGWGSSDGGPGWMRAPTTHSPREAAWGGDGLGSRRAGL